MGECLNTCGEENTPGSNFCSSSCAVAWEYRHPGPAGIGHEPLGVIKVTGHAGDFGPAIIGTVPEVPSADVRAGHHGFRAPRTVVHEGVAYEEALPPPPRAKILAYPSCPPPLGGLKFDDGKLPIHLLPFDALLAVTEVLQFGAKKYAPNNWRKGFVYSRLFRAAVGHLWSWWMGDDKDNETGLSHLAHAACCVLFLLHFTIADTGTDDRAENNV